MHYTICLKLISSSAQVALPPAFARLEQRGDDITRQDLRISKRSINSLRLSEQFWTFLSVTVLINKLGISKADTITAVRVLKILANLKLAYWYYKTRQNYECYHGNHTRKNLI